MITVRHRTASGPDDGEGWDLRRGYIDARVRRGSTIVHLWIAVCSPLRPVFGAAPIVRLDGEAWVIMPTRFERTWPKGIETMTAGPCGIGDLLDHGEQLALVNAPEAVSAELERL